MLPRFELGDSGHLDIEGMALVVKALKIEIFVLCMIVLIGLAARSRRSLFSSTQQLLFSMLGYTSAAYIFVDMIWTLSDGVSTPVGITANWISNAVSFSLRHRVPHLVFVFRDSAGLSPFVHAL